MMRSIFVRAATVATTMCALLCAANPNAHGQAFEWPVELESTFGKTVVYQPQIESYAGNILEARAAVAVTTNDSGTPVFGAIWFEARMSTDLDERTVTCESVRVSAAKFPDTDQDKVDRLSRYLEEEIPSWDIVLSMDELSSSIEHIDTGEKALKNDPPEVIFSTVPSVLVLIDGDAILADLQDSNLKYVVNSAFYILNDPESKRYYLKGGNNWFAAADVMGEWQVATTLPASVQQVAKEVEEEEKKQEAEQMDADLPEDDPELGPARVPVIIVRTHPAELVLTDGEPDFAPIEGTNLLYMENTENDVLMDISTQRYYILISGRWYWATAMTGAAWTFVEPGDVPPDFAKIPADSEMGQVLASVAGTQEAKEAVLESTIPQTAEVDRKTATVTVTYDGDPEFEKCGDNVAYAINTDKQVLLVSGTYYCCHEAIWFVSNGPTGPWQVAIEVPKEIQEIPPDCPAYNVKYVYIYDSTPEVVYVGYTSGYAGVYTYGGCVYWGTGWYYHPWYRTYYYPRPVTWGFHAHYNPWTGWGLSFGVSYGWLHISVGRPWYGGWWGPAGYRHGYRHGYHHGYRHGYNQGRRAGYKAGYRAGQHKSNKNMYRNQQGVKRTGGQGQAARNKPKTSNQKNNVYADRNGNVYRNQGSGDWQKRNNNQNNWSSSKGNQSVNRDQQNRQRSNQRTQQNKSASRNRGGGRRR